MFVELGLGSGSHTAYPIDISDGDNRRAELAAEGARS
ncbi:unnamed protein product [Urochloa humidicola]